MGWIIKFLTSSIGSKVLMALSGAALLGFVVMHMLGNLQVFLGADALNAYAKGLHDLGALLWVARLGLLGALFVHVVMAFRLWSANREARPSRYAFQATVQAPITSRSMIMSGASLLLFIVYHLLHFTLGVVGAEYSANTTLTMLDGEQVRDVYHMVVTGFAHPAVSLSYIAAMLLLGAHLSHGIQSLFQSLGLSAPKYRPLIKKAGPGLAAVLVLGNISMPVAVLLGLIKNNV
jgi:succinate dehydrogenase / fumarate reductase cytochrome b subunit